MWPIDPGLGQTATGEWIGKWAPGYWSPTPVAGAIIAGVGGDREKLARANFPPFIPQKPNVLPRLILALGYIRQLISWIEGRQEKLRDKE